MKQVQVAIVVVNWNLKNETLCCLHSLERLDLPDRVSYHVTVVDNGSCDGSAQSIARRFPESRLISLPSNTGFGAGCNRAIEHLLAETGCEFVFLMNNDTVADPRALSELIQAAEAHPEAGILGPKIYYQHRPRTIWYAGARRRWGVLAAADTGRGQPDRGQFGVMREVDYVFGAAMLVRRSVFERVGSFDERFFVYLEDMDLCLRAQDAGFSLLFVPQAQVWHKGSASTAHDNGLRKHHFVSSTVRFVRKHTAPPLIPLAIAFWSLVLLRFVFMDVVRGNLSAVGSYWAGLVSGLRLKPSDG
jgi:hypothetical protein